MLCACFRKFSRVTDVIFQIGYASTDHERIFQSRDHVHDKRSSSDLSHPFVLHIHAYQTAESQQLEYIIYFCCHYNPIKCASPQELLSGMGNPWAGYGFSEGKENA